MTEYQIGRFPAFTSVIQALPASIPFVAPEALERREGHPILLRLGANESAFGVSPRAVRAMQEVAGQSHWYGDPECHLVRSALAKRLNVGLHNIVIGNGIDGLLGYIVRALVEPGVAVVTSLGTYPTFNYHVQGFGGTLHRVPYRADRVDLEGLIEKVRQHDARLVYLANPDNPSGSWHSAAEVSAFIRELPESCALVLDEAYSEFAKDAVTSSLNVERPNVIRLRTFSKAHGLAGARIGYALAASGVIGVIERFRNQFEVSRVAQAGAIASLNHPEFVDEVVRAVEEGRQDYQHLATSLGIPTIDSATNFLCIDVGGVERASQIVREMLKQGVFIRMPGESPLNRCIRVTVGTPSQRAHFADVLRSVWQAIS